MLSFRPVRFSSRLSFSEKWHSDPSPRKKQFEQGYSPLHLCFRRRQLSQALRQRSRVPEASRVRGIEGFTWCRIRNFLSLKVYEQNGHDRTKTNSTACFGDSSSWSLFRPGFNAGLICIAREMRWNNFSGVVWEKITGVMGKGLGRGLLQRKPSNAGGVRRSVFRSSKTVR